MVADNEFYCSYGTLPVKKGKLSFICLFDFKKNPARDLYHSTVNIEPMTEHKARLLLGKIFHLIARTPVSQTHVQLATI